MSINKTPACFPRLNLLPGAIAFMMLFFACKQTEAPVVIEKPDDNRFTKSVLTQGLDEPMEFNFIDNDRILIIERKGGVKILDPKTKEIKLIATIPVNTKYTSKEGAVSEAEEGLVGLAVHPKFSENHWVYLYYADPDTPLHVLGRWELHGDSLYPGSKKIVLEIPTQREVCCHTGGGMVFDNQANLYLTVGNNTWNPPDGTTSMDERPGRESFDDQRGSGNTNNLHGKILRIHPENDGSYTIPEGNLFPKGTPKTRPEIYVMGDRNPWRVSVDSKTGFLYWGEVGPDASQDSIWGSRGYDEYNQARKAGYFGWPYFIGDNQTYAKYNPETKTYGPRSDPNHPVNNSPNNNGLKELPLPQKPLIWYPYAKSDSFPLLGSSGRSATGGPVFRKADFANAKRPFPEYYEGKWLITDFMRGWIMSVSMDEAGNYKSMEQFLPNENFSSAIDMKFGPQGDLFILEYGSAWFRGNANSAVVKIEYNGGNRKPVVEASADKTAGAVPFTVKLSSQGTKDFDRYDSNALKYEWKVVSGAQTVKTSAEPNTSITLDQPGTYQCILTVTDTKGEANSKTVELQAGNEPPDVSLNITKGNKTFFFPGQPVEYAIDIKDKEDGSVADGKIKADQVAVSFDYVPQGFDLIEISQHHRAAEEKAGFSAGLYLINGSDCKTCHMLSTKSVGPSFMDVATKYKNDAKAPGVLANKIISGGSGVWGEHAMAGHPQLSQQQAGYMVKYILGLSQKESSVKSLPLKGSYQPTVPTGENGKGGFLFRAAYTDRGSGSMGSQSSEVKIALRNPAVDPENADEKKGTEVLITPSKSFFMKGNGSYLGFNNIDLSGIKQIEFSATVTPQSGSIGGTIEVHLDAPDGKLIGQTAFLVSKPIDYARFFENSGGKGKGKAPAKKKAASAADFDFDVFRKMLAVKAPATISPTEGVHKVYIVCKNDKATDNAILMDMIEINFQNKSGGAPPAVK
ncbi:MAG TPA: PQQ-dependent sugar dehydrogenase [Puia sp.]|nr:PQQ-dependent sugar dehydrogenase [Puia sp.]